MRVIVVWTIIGGIVVASLLWWIFDFIIGKIVSFEESVKHLMKGGDK